MKYVADTHALVWFLEDNRRLSKPAKAVLLDSSSEIVIPTIVLAEAKFLFAKQRINIDLSSLYRRMVAARNCSVYPLDESVIDHMPTSLEIHDAIIVGTGLVIEKIFNEEVVVITRDETIGESGLIKTLW